MESFAPPKYPKSEKDRMQLQKALESQFLTQNLAQTALQTIIDSCCEKTYKAGENIITQREQGHEYYILKTGKCQVIIKEKPNQIKSKQLNEGEGFGEIALLYNEKRTATVRSLSECVVWALDGEIFKKIIVKTVLNRRRTEVDFLNKVDLFKNLDRYEKLSLLDGLKAVWFDRDDVIVREGDMGDLFYIVEEGHVECLQMCRKNSQQPVQRVIRKLTSGDHFGELALINNEKRTLTVKCGSEHLKLLTLDRKTFNRILGKIDKFLNRDYSDLVSF